jgi:hypothetical protein
MNPTRPDAQRTRFRRPLGVAVMGYKAILGLSEITVGVLLAIPSFDPQATFARLSAEERREDPGDRLVALVSRHLPALVWGGYLLAATEALLLPVDLRQAVLDPTLGHVLLAVANVAALVVLVLLLGGWLPGRPLPARPNRR